MYPSSSSARWSLPNPEYYTLRYADGPQLYITEQVSVRGSSDVLSKSAECLGLVPWNNTVLILEGQHLCYQKYSDFNGVIQLWSLPLPPLHAYRCEDPVMQCNTFSRVVQYRNSFTCTYKCALQIQLHSFPPAFLQFKVYVFFQTRCDIKNGTILQLAISPVNASSHSFFSLAILI